MKKRITAAALAALTFAAPLVTSAAFADTPARHDTRGQDNNRGRDDNRGRENDRRSDNRRDDNRHQAQRWDAQRNNGYTMNGRWYYGPPPAAYMNRGDFRPGYQNWRRGERLPNYYRAQFRQVDYRREHLRAPPRGYRYVRDNRGDTLLVGIATGVILSVIFSGR